MADLERANERAAGSERQAERLKVQLAEVTESFSRQQQAVDTEQENEASGVSQQAMDILKRSTLEVELAAKEKEVRLCIFLNSFEQSPQIDKN